MADLNHSIARAPRISSSFATVRDRRLKCGHPRHTALARSPTGSVRDPRHAHADRESLHA